MMQNMRDGVVGGRCGAVRLVNLKTGRFAGFGLSAEQCAIVDKQAVKLFLDVIDRGPETAV